MDLLTLIAAALRPDDSQVGTASTIDIDIPALVLRAQAGDSSAVAALYSFFLPAIYRYVVYRVPTAADAEDITAEVFVNMVQGLPAFRLTEVPFEAWLYRIAAARVADFYRHATRRPQEYLSETLPSAEPLLEERVEQVQQVETVRAALRKLSDEHQTILILRFVERKSHEEVAVILGKSMTAVKSAQHRALQHLTELLGSDHKIRHYLRGRHD